MKKTMIVLAVATIFASCGGNTSNTSATTDSTTVTVDSVKVDSVKVDTVKVK